ncbi:phage protein [Staphylococcus aureus]|nr:phage protein [Staphylococcus aureus]
MNKEKDSYVVELISFKIYISKADNNIEDIVYTENNTSLTKREWDKETTSKFIFELISSRISSEQIITDMTQEIADLDEQIKELKGENDKDVTEPK